MKAKIVDIIQSLFFIILLGLDFTLLVTTDDVNAWWHIPVICAMTIFLYKLACQWDKDSIERHDKENNPYMSQRNGMDHPEKA